MTLSGTVALPASCFRLLPDKHIVRMFMELVQNQSFTLTTCDNKQGKLCRLKNNVFLGIALGFPPFQLLYVRLALHNLQFLYLRLQSSNAILLWKLEYF